MKKFLLAIVMLTVLHSCSDEDVVTEPELCHPFFHAESLRIEVQHIPLPLFKIWVWYAVAKYKYELEGCSGKIHTHIFTFAELGKKLIDIDDTVADCSEPMNVQLFKETFAVTDENIFAGYDSLTVYFTLRGIFQRCNGGSAVSVRAIVWSDTVRAEVIDWMHSTTYNTSIRAAPRVHGLGFATPARGSASRY
jgi:hypothetical protein